MGASAVWGKLRQQIFLMRSREEREGKSFFQIIADSPKSPRLCISASPREIPRALPSPRSLLKVAPNG
jgi:hypothetical protein